MFNALLVYPAFPPSYWSEKYALQFVATSAVLPPLGLMSVAAFFPEQYNLKLVDMNVDELHAEDLEWCDAVFISAMVVQRKSFAEVVSRCNERSIPVVAGGPYPSSFRDEMHGVNHLLIGEAELMFPQLLSDLENGEARPVYEAPCSRKGETKRPHLSTVPLPRYDLINVHDYGSMAVQFSRGCPFNCEFCDITKLYGRMARTKSSQQVLEELQLLYDLGWRRSVFFVDDNFIGNGRQVAELLPALAEWQKAHGYPFSFYTEASVNLAGMPELMKAMTAAGFEMVFVGIETPNPKALRQANKNHNLKGQDADYLSSAVREIQRHGMEVSGGFILGLDGDDESCFEAQFDFIQHTGIATAMVGLLTALKGTDLYARLEREDRLLHESSGDNVSVGLNYVPQMDPVTLLTGYKQLLSRLYDRSLSNYFERCLVLIENWNHQDHSKIKVGKRELYAIARSFSLQLLSRQGPAYLKFLAKVLWQRPSMLSEAIRLAIMGYHYEKVTRQQIMLHDFKQFLVHEDSSLKETISQFAKAGSEQIAEAQYHLRRRVAHVQQRYRKIHKDFRNGADEALHTFQESIQAHLLGFRPVLQLEMPPIF